MQHNNKDSDKVEIIQMSQELEKQIESLIQDAFIPGMSIATISQGSIQTAALGYADIQSQSRVNSETQFWACSLSKPVFAYLVLKLTKDGTLPENFLDEDILWDEELFGPQGEKKLLTPKMLLSHQTGLPNNERPFTFKFNPGEGFRYSGEGYFYLQKIIEEKTNKSLEELAQDKIFGPSALNMTRTTFLFPEEGNKATAHDQDRVPNPLEKSQANNSNAAASLHTTANDYARFLMACMNDKDFLDLITPQIASMEKDIDANEKGLKSETLKPIDWGMGFGLQKNKDGKVVAAFHWGHGPGTRSFFVINLEHPQSALVYLTNSDNGLGIAKNIAKPVVGDISVIMKFLSDKYGYKDISSPKWEKHHEGLKSGLHSQSLFSQVYKPSAETESKNTILVKRLRGG